MNLAMLVLAVFTVPETAQVLKVFDAGTDIRTAERYVLAAVSQSNPLRQDDFKAVFTKFANINREYSTAEASLIGISTAQQTPVPDARSASLARFYFFEARISARIGEVKTVLTSLQSELLTNAVYQDAINRANNQYLAGALAKLSAFDSTLSYADPLPPLVPPFTKIKVIGPHGDYLTAQWSLYFAKKYAHDGVEESLLGLYDGSPDWVNTYSNYTNLLDSVDSAMRLYVPLFKTPAEVAEDRFCQILRVERIVTVDVPFRFNAMLSFFVPFLPVEDRQFIARTSDSWKHLDAGTWQALNLTESARCPGLQ